MLVSLLLNTDKCPSGRFLYETEKSFFFENSFFNTYRKKDSILMPATVFPKINVNLVFINIPDWVFKTF